MNNSALVEFLGSFKNAESIGPEIRTLISVDTGLESSLLAAVDAEMLVLVTGSAGSGKTHLLETLRRSKYKVVTPEERPPTTPHILLVRDATEWTAEERRDFVRRRTPKATVIAINEGPLRETANLDGAGPYRLAVEMLRTAQLGLAMPADSTRPCVIDMGAYDPIDAGVLASILALPALKDVVYGSECGCPPDVCPRRTAWAQFQHDQARTRAAEALRLANLIGPSWLFRDLWDFVGDMVLGGDCANDPPTSPWFWRMFFGHSRLSAALRDICDPAGLPLPRADGRLWYGDWTASELQLVDGAELLQVSRPDLMPERFTYMKTQMAVLGAHTNVPRLLAHTNAGQLRGALLAREPLPFIASINQYMVYGTLPTSHTQLDLWVDHSVERRTSRAPCQIRLGRVPAADVEIRPSIAVVNRPDGGPPFPGTKRFLVHSRSGASLELTSEKLVLLEEGRSPLRSQRPHTDLEWDLLRFFARILEKEKSSDEVGVATFEFSRLSGHLYNYRVGLAPPVIERADL